MYARFLFPPQRLTQTFAVAILAAGLAALPAAAHQYPQDNSQTAAQSSQSSAPANRSSLRVPSSFTLPEGTLISVRTAQELSSNQNHVGDTFSADLTQPLVVGGWVVARRGQSLLGRVEAVQKAGRVKGQSKLTVELTRLVLVDGQQFPIETQLIQASGGTSHLRDATTVGMTTTLGAIIGAATGGDEGAGIGAAIGAGSGLAGVLLTRGRPTVLPAESLLTFQLQRPITFSTEGSAQAFQPVTQTDYTGSTPRLRRRTDHIATRRRYSPPPPYDYPYYYGPWGYYGYSPGLYIGYGFGGYGCWSCGYGYGGFWHRDFDDRDFRGRGRH